jgi:putative radical SAM enzyme (TIGR03279 family)
MRAAGPARIAGVRPGSLAAEAGIEAGDSVVSLDGRVLRDVVDLQFYQAEPEVRLHVRKADGLDELLVFEKEIDEDLGLEFERATWDEVTLCNNNCFFCFLKGLPKGMRKTLYVKDDDYRLSFLHGNFVTLTNLDEEDWARLEEQRLSPLNVSVHATDPELRRKMLGNASAPDIVAQLRRLGDLGIRAHTQIVLCPGVNDGEQLDRSVRELAALYPAVQTVSVVPVGASPKLEDWSLARDGIELVRPSAEYASAVVRQMRPLQRACRQAYGATVVQCSDEYYVLSGESIPGRSNYDDFPQYENGVGMMRVMLDDWARTRRRLELRQPAFSVSRAVVACGTLVGPRLSAVATELSGLARVDVDVRPVTNTVFGERVNVSGLLCGKDYVEQLRGLDADCFILPRPSLDYFGKRFLDNMTVEELEANLGAPVAFASRWSDVVRILEQGGGRAARNAASNGAIWSEEPAGRGASARRVS